MTADAACPKCGRSRAATAESCPRCGLVFAMWSAERAAESATLDGEALRLWTELEARWQDEAAHDAFVKQCSQRGLLGAAGRAYRDRLDRDAGDAVALRMQKRIVAMATAALAPSAAPRTPVTRMRWFAWVVAGSLALGTLAGLLWRFRG